jgi:mycothiol synthase
MPTMSSTDITFRAFLPEDMGAVVVLWNRCLPRDPMTEERFWRQFLLDPNFDVSGNRIAQTTDGNIVGFLQAIVRREPYGSIGLQEQQGWITAFFVDPDFRRQGIGTALLQEGLAFVRAQGRTRVSCNGYAPYYQFPGVDLQYSEAHSFLQSCGFTSSSEAVAMEMSLKGGQVPKAILTRYEDLWQGGYRVRPFQRTDTLPLLAFAEQYFPHWTPSLRDGLVQGNEEIIVATFHDEIIAYAQWQNPHNDPPHGAPGRFGPFGVHPNLRSRGIGAIVFWTMVERVAVQGAPRLWFGWAGGQNVAFYERAGCQIVRRFQLYAKSL